MNEGLFNDLFFSLGFVIYGAARRMCILNMANGLL